MGYLGAAPIVNLQLSEVQNKSVCTSRQATFLSAALEAFDCSKLRSAHSAQSGRVVFGCFVTSSTMAGWWCRPNAAYLILEATKHEPQNINGNCHNLINWNGDQTLVNSWTSVSTSELNWNASHFVPMTYSYVS